MDTKTGNLYSNILGIDCWEKCPQCGSTELIQTADHSSDGYNGYICKDCGCKFGN